MNNEFLFSRVYKEVGCILKDLETMVTIDRATEYNAKGAAFHRKNIVRAFVQARKKVENLEVMCIKHNCIDGADYWKIIHLRILSGYVGLLFCST